MNKKKTPESVLVTYNKEAAAQDIQKLHQHITDMITRVQAPFNERGLVWMLNPHILEQEHDRCSFLITAVPQSGVIDQRFVIGKLAKLFWPVEQLFEYRFDSIQEVATGSASVWITFELRNAHRLEQVIGNKVRK